MNDQTGNRPLRSRMDLTNLTKNALLVPGVTRAARNKPRPHVSAPVRARGNVIRLRRQQKKPAKLPLTQRGCPLWVINGHRRCDNDPRIGTRDRVQLAGLAIAADRPIDGRLGPDVREQKWSPSTRGSHSIWCANVSVILKNPATNTCLPGAGATARCLMGRY